MDLYYQIWLVRHSTLCLTLPAEAVKIAKEKLESGDLDDIGWQEIENIKEVLQPRDNGGETTAELYHMEKNGDVLEVYNNKLGKVENI
mgnify:CR=1 FL=1